MKCVVCKTGEVAPGKTTVILQRGETTVVVKDVPAQVCDNCGEYYLSAEMTEKVMALAESAVRKGAEVEILRWAA
ncbi:type II toxin-antitoxin system MqsA family antitoxin [Thioalkalivibrio sp.]|uniref:type II toxin-antitoxin system MqsA family antitoxin n=1 Tax=Thioalkalivibrio sp. TaxID=2093813 RepID=UPI00397568C2